VAVLRRLAEPRRAQLQAWLAKLGRSAKQAHRTLALEVLQALASKSGSENTAEAMEVDQVMNQPDTPVSLSQEVLSTVIRFT
jgi:hypothetical protein